MNVARATRPVANDLLLMNNTAFILNRLRLITWSGRCIADRSARIRHVASLEISYSVQALVLADNCRSGSCRLHSHCQFLLAVRGADRHVLRSDLQ
jgi:hypothetical protein